MNFIREAMRLNVYHFDCDQLSLYAIVFNKTLIVYQNANDVKTTSKNNIKKHNMSKKCHSLGN